MEQNIQPLAIKLPTKEPTPVKKKELLADYFSRLLQEAGHPNPEAWKKTPGFSIHPDHIHCDEPLQRFHVNRQIRMVLGVASTMMNVCTINLRCMLIDQQDAERREWAAPVKNSIVPFFIKHNLPL